MGRRRLSAPLSWSSRPHGVSRARTGLDFAGRADLLVVLFLGVLLFIRVMTDDLSAPDSRHSGSINLSAAIAVLFILAASVLLLQRRRGVVQAVATTLWLCVWTGVAVHTRGASTETLREGVREGSVVALAVIVYNCRDSMTVPIATRLIQLVSIFPAVLALYQLAAHTGMDVAGNLRSNGTFAQPNSAAMFLAIVTTVSLWRYIASGRHRVDGLLTCLFAGAFIATFSIDGLATLVAMLIALGTLQLGSRREKAAPCALAIVLVLVFFATPLGSSRIAKESSTSLASAERGEANSTLAWRLHKWKTLLPEWERAPVFGQGLGTTTTVEGPYTNEYIGALPHNEYLRYLVETGIIGLALVLGGLALLVSRLIRLRRTSGASDAATRSAAALAIAIVAGCLVNSLADNTFLNSPTCYAATLIVVAALGSVRITTERSLNRPST
jgi:O-antigen ligase